MYSFIPNLIGYCRVALTVLAIYSAFACYRTFVVAYSVGAILDLFDGMAARHFNQESKFGALLDMVTDRVSTNLLYLVLAVMYPGQYFLFAMLAGLDYASHWTQMYAAALTGSHHKVLNSDRNWLLRMYYSKKPFLFLCCVCQETFLIAIYAHHHAGAELGQIFYYIAAVAGPVGALKQLINLIQLGDACKQIVKLDVQARRSE